MLNCRRNSSNKLYNTYIRKWWQFCQESGADPISPTIPNVLEFLQCLREEPGNNRGYSAICTARSALSSFLILPNGQNLGDNKFVKQFIKGVYNMNPPSTRYTRIWDPATLLAILVEPPWIPFTEMTLELLVQKLIFLILIITGQRGQFIVALDINNMEISETTAQFKVDNKDLKQGRPGYKPGLVKIQKYVDNQELCVVTLLQEYMKRTAHVREDITKVFITTTKPFRPVSRDTVSRWVKALLKAAGINTAEFGAGSTRAASSSKANKLGVPLEEIMASAGWSQVSTFSRFYKKEIIRNCMPKAALSVE